MTQLPPLPRSRRNLDDLDALIDASIGKSSGPQNTPLPQSDTKPVASKEDASTEPTKSPVEAAPERFRVSIDPALIVATKLAALRRKVAPSDIVEQALKQFLGPGET